MNKIPRREICHKNKKKKHSFSFRICRVFLSHDLNSVYKSWSTRKMENSCLLGVQGDSSFYGNQRDTLVLPLVCVELDKIPLLHKLKQLYRRLPVGAKIITIIITKHTIYNETEKESIASLQGVCGWSYSELPIGQYIIHNYMRICTIAPVYSNPTNQISTLKHTLVV